MVREDLNYLFFQTMIMTEFFQHQHFTANYKVYFPSGDAGLFIDAIWESDYVSDADLKNDFLFRDRIISSVGSTITINLGSAFQLHFGNRQYTITEDYVYSRHLPVLSTHFIGNKMMGIRMKCNVLSEPIPQGTLKMNRDILPKEISDRIRTAIGFEQRCDIIMDFVMNFVAIKKIKEVAGSISQSLNVMENMLSEKLSVIDIAREIHCSTKTMERFFEKYLWDSPKKCFRILRFRNALKQYVSQPEEFSIYDYGYYDFSHFYREVKEFTGDNLGGLRQNGKPNRGIVIV